MQAFDESDDNIQHVQVEIDGYIIDADVNDEYIECVARNEDNEVQQFIIDKANGAINVDYWVGLQAEIYLEPPTYRYIIRRASAPLRV